MACQYKVISILLLSSFTQMLCFFQYLPFQKKNIKERQLIEEELTVSCEYVDCDSSEEENCVLECTTGPKKSDKTPEQPKESDKTPEQPKPSTVPPAGDNIDWCNITSCGPPGDHTMCKYKSGLKCKGKAGLTVEEKKYVLDEHNRLRQKVANGELEGQPGASNMLKLSWNNLVETVAQRWSDQCKPAHDTCRDLPCCLVGQNAINGWVQVGNKDLPEKLVYAVNGWFKEYKVFPANYIDTLKYDDKYGHYTQLVWAETSEIGCGFVEHATEPKHTNNMFDLRCNYKIAGNLIDGQVYKKGKACSECPKGSRCSKRYPGLCTAEKDEYNDVPS